MGKPNNNADIKNPNKGTFGTNRSYDQNQVDNVVSGMFLNR